MNLALLIDHLEQNVMEYFTIVAVRSIMGLDHRHMYTTALSGRQGDRKHNICSSIIYQVLLIDTRGGIKILVPR